MQECWTYFGSTCIHGLEASLHPYDSERFLELLVQVNGSDSVLRGHIVGDIDLERAL